MKRLMKKIAVGMLAASVCMSSVYAVPALADASTSENSSDAIKLIDTAEALINIDVSSNAASISMLLDQVLEKVSGNLAASILIRSAQQLVNDGSENTQQIIENLESARVLIESADADDEETGGEEAEAEEATEPETEAQEETVPQEPETQETVPEESEETAQEETTAEPETEEVIIRTESGLDPFIQDKYMWAVMNLQISLQVPSDWGNNQSDSAITNYTPANRSGAISPQSGTLQTQYFVYSTDDAAAFEEYENGISKASSTTSFNVQDTTAAGMAGRRIQYVMTLGANQFECEAVCFEYDSTMYVVQILQGNKRTADFYDIFDTSVGSIVTGIMENETEAETEACTEEETEPYTEPTPETEPYTEPEPETEPYTEPTPETEPYTEPDGTESEDTDTLESFIYYINGHEYVFPTAVSHLEAGDLAINTDDIITYDIKSDGSTGGIYNELANTSYYFFSGNLCSEMAGVTNLSGYDIPVSQGILTELVDMDGSSVDLTLPGGVRVGAEESTVLNAFPQFQGMTMDGLAGFIGNDYLYACNVRDDGCNGYVIIKNNAPYYSTLSVICENGYVREICFECIGSIRADGVFLPE